MSVRDTSSAPVREKARIFVTGSCDGLDQLRDALERHAEVELVGTSVGVAESAGTLTGGHLEARAPRHAELHAPRPTRSPRSASTRGRRSSCSPPGEASVLLEEALDADVSDVLLLPQMTENVVFAIRKAAGRPATDPVSAPTRRGRIVTVFSPKGGTGKTVTSTNLAAAFAKFEGKRTLLLDLDLQFGDAAIMLGLEPEKTIYDLVVAPGELDSEKLAGYTTRHPSGLDILPAPVRPEDAELVTETKLSRLLEVARESYDIIVVDTSPFFHGPMLATLDRTDELLLVCGLDVPTLKNVRLALQTLELLAFPQNRIRLVLNRANSKVGHEAGRGRGRPRDEGSLRGSQRPGCAHRGQPRKSRRARRARRGLLEGDPRDGEGPPAGRGRQGARSAASSGRASRWVSTIASRAPNGGGQPRPRSRGVETASREAQPEHRAVDPYAELKTRIHHACIAKLGPELF